MKNLQRHIQSLTYLLALGFVVTLVLSSCASKKNVAYFRDISDSINNPIVVSHHKYVEPKIKVDDLLSISIGSVNDIGLTRTTEREPGNADLASVPKEPVYLVNRDGSIDVPIVGHIKVAGRTTVEIRDIIYEKAKKYYVDPIVNVRFANFNFTVLGDVNAPGTYTVANEKVSVIDALGQAGDIAITGRRDNVLLVRELDDDSKVFVRLDVRSSDIIKSPYFYLQSSDVLYIEPIPEKVKTATRDATKDRYIPYIFSGISLVLTVITFVIRVN